MMNKKLIVVCLRAILVAGLGVSALDVYAKEKKHLLECPAKNQLRNQLTSAQ